MRKLYKDDLKGKVYLVSGDGDYYRMVHFLKEEGKLGKVLFPAHHKASSLYRQIEQRYWNYLDDADTKRKIAFIKKSKTR